jgi:drug/metabolite transporter (DMT)-like permease
MAKPQYSKGALLCLIATLSWGAMFPIMGHVLKHVDPFLFATMRYGLAGIAFVVLLVVVEGRGALNIRGERALLAWFFGSAGFAGFGFLAFLGQQLAGRDGALTASIIMATQPLLALLVNWALRKVVPPGYSFLFILLSFFGIVLVVTKGDLSLAHAPRHYGANALILAGALCWVLYTVGATFYPTWSAIKYTTVSTLLGLTSVVAINGFLYAAHVLPVPTTEAIASIMPDLAYMVVVAGCIGVLAWNSGNKILTPINGMLFINLVPLTAFVISAFQGIVPSGAQVAGACFTASAIISNNLYVRYRSAAESASLPGRRPVPNLAPGRFR